MIAVSISHFAVLRSRSFFKTKRKEQFVVRSSRSKDFDISTVRTVGSFRGSPLREGAQTDMLRAVSSAVLRYYYCAGDGISLHHVLTVSVPRVMRLQSNLELHLELFSSLIGLYVVLPVD